MVEGANEPGASVEEFGLREADSNIAQRELAFSPDGRYFATTQSWTLPYKITVYDSQDISHPRQLQAPAGIYLASGVNGYAAAIWKP